MTWYAKLLALMTFEVLGRALCWASFLAVLLFAYAAFGQTTGYGRYQPQTWTQQQQQQQIRGLQERVLQLQQQQRRDQRRETNRAWQRYHLERGEGRNPAFPFWNR